MAKSRARRTDRKERTDTRAGKRPQKKKVCIFCADSIAWVDYKDVNLLRKFLSERAKIRARRVTGNCTQHQRDVAVAIKTARELALLPYAMRQVADRTKGGGRRRDRDGDRGERESAPSIDAIELESDLELGEELDEGGDGIEDVELSGDELTASVGGLPDEDGEV
jgi:small subunit ribosomal protein S18